MYVSHEQAYAQFDQNLNIEVGLKPEYKNSFLGDVEIRIMAASGIVRDEDDFTDIEVENCIDYEGFTVRFTPCYHESCEEQFPRQQLTF